MKSIFYPLKKYTVTRYIKEDELAWNDFVRQAKNGNFLFHRDFMDYHQDRFEDYSLIITEKDKWVAIFPANVKEDKVHSHQGLTFGGLIFDKNIKQTYVIDIFKEILQYYHSLKYTSIFVKQIPNFYNRLPSEELLYTLFLAQARLTRRDSLAVIDLSKKIDISGDRLKGIRKGVQNNLRVQEKTSFDDFWNLLLIPNLKQKHNVSPVHTVEEMMLLKSHFPMNIRQFNVYHFDKLVGGTTLFISDQVVHVQYTASLNGQSDLGNLDFLFHHLMTNIFPSKKYFDFGCSNEAQGTKINVGLSYWKESFGAGIMIQDFYEVGTANYSYLLNYSV